MNRYYIGDNNTLYDGLDMDVYIICEYTFDKQIYYSCLFCYRVKESPINVCNILNVKVSGIK